MADGNPSPAQKRGLWSNTTNKHEKPTNGTKKGVMADGNPSPAQKRGLWSNTTSKHGKPHHGTKKKKCIYTEQPHQ